MKDNKTKVLVAILLFQVALFFVTKGEKTGKVFDKTQDLVTLNFSEVDRFSIATSEEEFAEFVKEDEGWSIPAHFNFPAESKKIQGLFETLKGIKQSWPAGKTLLSAKQFSVTAEKYEKRFDFYKGEELLGTLYLGSSPSFKKVHMRLEGEENTYVASFSSFEYPAKGESWLNRGVYKTPKSEIASLHLGKFTLKASGEGKFTLGTLQSSEETNTSRANQTINQVINPSFKTVLARDSFKKGNSVLSYSLRLKDGSERKFQYFEKSKEKVAKEGSEEDKNLVLKVSDSPFYFEVARSEVKELLDLKRKDLIKPKEVSLKENDDNSSTN